MADATESTESQSIHPGRRLTTGLGQTVTGTVNVARGLTGLGLSTLWTLISLLIRAARGPQLTAEEQAEVAALEADGAGCRTRKPLLIALAVVGVLALGGVAFKLLRTPQAPPVAPEPPRVRQIPTSEEIDAEQADDGSSDSDEPDEDLPGGESTGPEGRIGQ
jgi:hypothetical protein